MVGGSLIVIANAARNAQGTVVNEWVLWILFAVAASLIVILALLVRCFMKRNKAINHDRKHPAQKD